MIPRLLAHRDSNGCAFQVVHGAVAYGVEEVRFAVDENVVGSAIRDGDEVVTARTVQLAEIVQTHGFETFSLICDIEGAELDLIEHEADLLRERVKTLIIEWHPHTVGAARTTAAQNAIAALGFNRLSSEGDVCVYRRTD
jgi:FkbM family methyltransferase